jgi:20S proteasome subunit alpha 1
VTQLEKQFKKNDGNWNEKEAIEVAIKVLQAVVSSDFKASDIEVGIATVSKPLFRKLKVAEVEAVLAEMHDAL